MSDSSPIDPVDAEVRRLLRTEVDVDPLRRERAISAALAAAGGDGADDLGSDRHGDDDGPGQPPLVPFTSRRPPRRLRVLATAAAILLVVAGLAGTLTVLNTQGSTQSSSEDAGGTVTADRSTTSADRSAAAGSGAAQVPELLASTTVPGAVAATGVADAFPGVSSAGLVDLGDFADVASLLGTASGLVPTAASGSATAADPSSRCGAVLNTAGTQLLASARVAGQPVLVVRSSGTSTTTMVTVLASPDCSVLASG